MDNETRKQAALRRTASILNTIVPQNNSTSQQNGELTKTSKEEEFKSVKFLVDEEKRIGTIVLARPSRLNAIDRFMPSEIRRAGFFFLFSFFFFSFLFFNFYFLFFFLIFFF